MSPNAGFPALSGLVFSRVDMQGNELTNWQLNLSEVFQLDLAADLVVLSACQTALGEEIRGEGLVGMVQGFMYAGAHRVVASLWSVRDKSTAELMTMFYENMTKNGLPPAAALRAAQRDFLEKFPRHQAPLYWAGFTLQGDY